MTGARSFAAWIGAVKPHTASLLLHSGALAAVILLTPLAAPQKDDVLAVDIVEALDRTIAPRPAPPTEQERLPPVPDDPEPARPQLVPHSARQRLVDKARAYQAEVLAQTEPLAAATATVTSLEPSEPAPLFEVPMEATVGGGDGIEVVSGVGRGEVRAQPGAPGVRGGKGKARPTRRPRVQATDSWELTAQPEPLNDHRLEPKYPPDARAQGLEGAVVVELVIDDTGRVASARVVRSSSDMFNLEAIAHCRRLRFRPAEANGKPVSARIEWRVDFRFRNR